MDYRDKYIKYKKKYLELKNIQAGGGMKFNISFEDGMQMYKKTIETSQSLEKVYENFWTNIYYNDAYVFYKNAVEYYKNIHNNKFHNFFSSVINKKLYTGSCQHIDVNMRKEFSNKDKIKKIDLDDLCNLSVQVINTLDSVFTVCPTLPFNITTYRIETREKNDDFLKLKKGDYYKNLGYMSTTINPWYLNSKDIIRKDKKINIVMTIYLPSNTQCYYMIYPFGIYYDKQIKKNIGAQEHEIFMGRNNIFKVLETKLIDSYFFIKLLIVHQMIPNNTNMVETNSKNMATEQSYFNRKEYKQLNKNNYTVLESNAKDFIMENTKTNIYEDYKTINVNKSIKDIGLFYGILSRIDNKTIQEWTTNKPIFDEKKYSYIPEKEFEKNFNNIYNDFIPYVSSMKKKKNMYINVSMRYKQNNELYIDILTKLKLDKKIQIIKPLFVAEYLTHSVLSDSIEYITTNQDENMLYTNKIDTNFPLVIIIKYKQTIDYIPLYSDVGFTFYITELNIEKIDKIFITDTIFYYYVEAS